MRNIVIVFSLAFFMSNLANAQKHSGPIKWYSLQEADSLYQTNPKPLFIDVYTDWCGWCKRMDATTFQDKSIANYLNSNFYPVKLDAETNDSIRFQGKMYYNSQKETIARIMDSLTLDLKDAVKKNNININEKKAQLNNLKRRSRKTTHDVAIYLCNGQLSYPTFNLLFGDSLRGNMPLKGFQKVPDLFGYLAFVSEGIYNTSRNVSSFVNTFKEVYTPGYEEPKDLIKWKGFEQALDVAQKDNKKILVHLIHPTSIASNLMDKESFRDSSTASKINSNLHAVKLAVNSNEVITYFDKEYKNVSGIHNLVYLLSQNQLVFPQFVFLDKNGKLIMKVPQYFGKTEIDPVLDYFIEEGYLSTNYGDWLKAKKQ